MYSRPEIRSEDLLMIQHPPKTKIVRLHAAVELTQEDTFLDGEIECLVKTGKPLQGGHRSTLKLVLWTFDTTFTTVKNMASTKSFLRMAISNIGVSSSMAKKTFTTKRTTNTEGLLSRTVGIKVFGMVDAKATS